MERQGVRDDKLEESDEETRSISHNFICNFKRPITINIYMYIFLISFMFLGRARDSVMKEVNLEFENDPSLLADIVSALPKKMESTLNLHKNRLLGSLPKTMDDFDPTSLLSKLDGGSKIIVLDSNKDLPENWKYVDLKKTFGLVTGEEEDGDDLNHDVASTDECSSTDGAASTDGGGSTDGASGDEAASSTDGGASIDGATGGEVSAAADECDDDLEYQEVAADSTIDVSKVKKPKRVLVFTTVVMLGLLAVCKNGSVDGTFKAMTRKWKQLFIFMVDYRGAFLPVAFSWLPDKHAISYHISLLLTLSKFKQEQSSIMKIYGRGTLKVKKIKLDFELAIHRAFEPLFKLKGCFFHFSQAGWRKVQNGGMVVSYMNEKQFRDFIRSVIALAFLPMNQIEAAVDDLRAVEFDKEITDYDKISAFKDQYLDYIETTWLYGNFPPKLWNQWKKTRNLTNNQNEGYNSRINKILAAFHPNPWVLVCMLVKELIRAEMEALWIKVRLGSTPIP